MELEEKMEVDGRKREREVNEGKGGDQSGKKKFSAERRIEEGGGGKGRIRRATFDDLEAIMDINDNVYDGLDYMPAMFYTFMHSKLHVIYVYEEDGKLVSLINLRLYPECPDLAALMSERVRSSHQGRGLGFSDSAPIKVLILKEHPKITRSIGDTLYRPNVATKMHKRKLLYHWNFLTYKIADRLWLNRFTHIRQMAQDATRPFCLSYARGAEWLERSDHLVRFVSKYAVDFFPVSHSWTPIPISRSGLRDAFSVANVMVSFSPAVTPASDKSCFPDRIPSTGHVGIEDSGHKRPEDGGHVDDVVGLSFSTGLACKYGFVIDIMFFGDCENVFLNHVYGQLFHYVNMTSDNDVRFSICLHFPLRISSRNVEERLKEAMGERLENKVFSATEVVQYIRNFPEAKL